LDLREHLLGRFAGDVTTLFSGMGMLRLKSLSPQKAQQIEMLSQLIIANTMCLPLHAWGMEAPPESSGGNPSMVYNA
jgi:hypothetical protein